jgi:hypothetical protein
LNGFERECTAQAVEMRCLSVLSTLNVPAEVIMVKPTT